jgi:hypothetical protein
VANLEKRRSQSNSNQQGRNKDNPERAESIVRELIKMARTASRRGYGTTQLIFSDWSFVSLTDSGVIGEVEELLRNGHKPLGFIAPDRNRERAPFVEQWEMGNGAAIAELRYLAHSIYWHLLLARNPQPDATIQEK